MKYASLCVLAYKRPKMLEDTLKSILDNTDYPYELIVNCDTDQEGVPEILLRAYKAGMVSKVVLSGGKNRGVGRSFANCIGVAEGDYIFKVDTDLIFQKGWLSQSVYVLENNDDVAVSSPFNYRAWDPNDTRFNVIEERPTCRIVDDLVSSVYGFRRNHIEIPGWINDDGYHQTLCNSLGMKMALTPKDLVTNQGFGIGKSTYVSGTMEKPFKTPTFDKPLIFGI